MHIHSLKPSAPWRLVLLGAFVALGVSLHISLSSEVRATAVPNINLNNGVTMPMISAGLWQVGRTETPPMISAATKVGFTHIDGSCVGYSNEHELGDTLSKLDRDSFFLTTKLDPPWQYGWPADTAYKSATAQLEGCLASHQVDYIDLLLYHYPPFGHMDGAKCHSVQETWRAMEALYHKGKVRALGVSNFCPSTFECLLKNATVKPAINQVLYHVGMGPDPGGIKSYSDKLGVQLQAYSPLGAGTSGHPRTPELLTGDLVSKLARKYGKTGAQVSLRWVAQHGVAVATESTNPQHLRDDLAIFEFELSNSDMAELDAATAPAGTYSFACDCGDRCDD